MFWKRFLFVSVLLLLAVTAAYGYLGQPSLGIDDALIFFVYGRNLAAGQGIVYAPGGEHVEGYSSTLWMLFIAAAYWILKVKPIWLVLVVSIALTVFSITLIWHWLAKENFWAWQGWLLLGWVFSAPAFVVWTNLTLMDTVLWMVVVSLGCVISINYAKAKWVALIVVAALLARPEGMLWSVVFVMAATITNAWQVDWRYALREARLPVLAYLLTLLALVTFRLIYFGYPFPNTYYAKVSPDLSYNLQEGSKYALGFLNLTPILGVALVAMCVGIGQGGWFLIKSIWFAKPLTLSEARRCYILTSFMALVGLMTPVLTGGDHFALFRFYQPIWMLLILPPIFLLTEIAQWSFLKTHAMVLKWRMVSVLAVVGFFSWTYSGWHQLSQYQDDPSRFGLGLEFVSASLGEQTGLTLNRIFAPRFPSVGAIGTGALGLTYQGRVIDLVGLNNVEMAHAPGLRYGYKNHAAFNAQVFFKQKPDLIVIGVAEAREKLPLKDLWAEWYFKTFGNMFLMSQYWELYQPAIISNGEIWLLVHLARDQPPVLRQQGLQVELLSKEQIGAESPFDFEFAAPEKFAAYYREAAAYLHADDMPAHLIVYPPHHLGEVQSTLRESPQVQVFKMGTLPLERNQLTAELTAATVNTRQVHILLSETDRGDPQSLIENWIYGNLFRVEERWFGPVRLIEAVNPSAQLIMRDAHVEVGQYVLLEHVGVSASSLAPGGMLLVRLVWRGKGVMTQTFKFFVHLIEGETLVAQYDGQPFNGLRPTNKWQAGETVIDQVALQIPLTAHTGKYYLRVGLYDLITQARERIVLPNSAVTDFYAVEEILVR